MVREVGFINDPKERKKVFEHRSETLLKQTRELATLCDTHVCIVVHTRDDPIKPCRIWPENENDLRSMVELYKRKTMSECKGSKKMGPQISKTDCDGGNGFTGLSAEQVKSVMVDIEGNIADVQKEIDSKTGNQSGRYYFAGRFWEENEVFDVDELLTLCEEGESDGHCLVESDTNTYLAIVAEPDEDGNYDVCEVFEDCETTQPSDECTSSSLSMSAPAVGTKRKVEQVFSFAELMAASSQRPKV